MVEYAVESSFSSPSSGAEHLDVACMGTVTGLLTFEQSLPQNSDHLPLLQLFSPEGNGMKQQHVKVKSFSVAYLKETAGGTLEWISVS